MRHMKKIVFFILYIFFFNAVQAQFPTQSQELNMKITINSDRISGTDKQKYTTLQDILNQFVNGRKWTDATFASNERIECSMLITIIEESDNSYKAEIQATSTRPVYNSSYNSPLFNYKDTEFEFDYIEGQSLEFAENNIDNNLTATIAFYVYVILGLDFDSFHLNGGKTYFDKAVNIVSGAQALNTKGWAAFGGDRNRYSLARALTDESTSVFHTLWYNYHRKGLDEMAANATRGRTEIEKTLPMLQQVYQSRPSSPLLYFFGDTKLDELVNVYSKATLEEKNNAVKILENIYPSKRHIIENLRK